MSIETSNTTNRDPRWRLVHEHYYTQRPDPLDDWLWDQGLPQAAERVFWLHWREGMRSGDWSSQVPIKRVAQRCRVDVSTVVRAYQLLKAKGLIRRQDPGRDESNPFHQATSVTEVLVPRELLVELARAPSRRRPPKAPPAAPDRPNAAGSPPSQASTSATDGDAPAVSRRFDRELHQRAMDRLSANERARYYQANREYRAHIEFDEKTRLTPEERAAVLDTLASAAARRPVPAASQPSKPTLHPTLRILGQFDLARARRRLLELLPLARAGEALREIVWAVEEGTLRRHDPAHALNIALKLVRDGKWTRPNRMPPNWQRALARPEVCTAA
jgi:DNA-binding MarR family transcriptional regulator